jgi:hypothetical protein
MTMLFVIPTKKSLTESTAIFLAGDSRDPSLPETCFPVTALYVWQEKGSKPIPG